MTELVRTIEGNYGRVATAVEAEPLVLDEALKKNIRITVGKLTNLEVSKIPQARAAEQIADTVTVQPKVAPRVNNSIRVNNTVFEVESVPVAENNAPNPKQLASRIVDGSSKKNFHFKFKKFMEAYPSAEHKSSNSNRSADSSVDIKASRSSRSQSKPVKSDAVIQFKNVLSTITEIQTLKQEDPKPPANENRKGQPDSSLDLRLRQTYNSPVSQTKRVFVPRKELVSEANTRLSVGQPKEINHRLPTKKVINLAELKKEMVSPKKYSAIQVESSVKVTKDTPELPAKVKPAAKIVAISNQKPLLANSEMKIAVDGLAEDNRTGDNIRKSVSTNNRIALNSMSRPASAYANIRSIETPSISKLAERGNILKNKDHTERSQTPKAISTQNRLADQLDKSKLGLAGSNLFLDKIKGPELKVYRVGDYHRNQNIQKRNRAKRGHAGTGSTNQVLPGPWSQKQDERQTPILLSSKVTSTKDSDISIVKRGSAMKVRAISKVASRLQSYIPRQDNELASVLLSKNEFPASNCSPQRKSQPDYCLLNLLYGVFAVASFTESCGAKIRQSIRYKITEGNNGRLIESLFRQKPYVESVALNSKANIQWSQLNHKNLVATSIKHSPKLSYKDLATRAELSGNDILNIKDLAAKVLISSVVKTESPQLIRQLLEANVRIGSINYLVSENIKIANHIDGISSISHKTKLTESIMRYAKAKGLDPFTIIPKTFLVRMSTFDPDIDKVSNAKRMDDSFASPVIVKPGENANRGCGISMAYNLKETVSCALNLLRDRKGTNCVIVQYYITNPLLYRKRKFDIRCYGLVVRFSGRTLYFWYKDGYARTSSFEFSVENKKNLMVHLTNEAVQVQGNR